MTVDLRQIHPATPRATHVPMRTFNIWTRVAIAGCCAWLGTVAQAADVTRVDKRTAGSGPLIGTPQVVRDPHWGDVLFYFYQGDYLQALTRLDAAQHYERVSQHTVEAELLKGGLYLSLGEHQEAGRIFTAC